MVIDTQSALHPTGWDSHMPTLPRKDGYDLQVMAIQHVHTDKIRTTLRDHQLSSQTVQAHRLHRHIYFEPRNANGMTSSVDLDNITKVRK